MAPEIETLMTSSPLQGGAHCRRMTSGRGQLRTHGMMPQSSRLTRLMCKASMSFLRKKKSAACECKLAFLARTADFASACCVDTSSLVTAGSSLLIFVAPWLKCCMGHHHGEEAFKEFSNARGYFVKGKGGTFSAITPPYDASTDHLINEVAYASMGKQLIFALKSLPKNIMAMLFG